jgi:predicted nucleic acid-binding protein
MPAISRLAAPLAWEEVEAWLDDEEIDSEALQLATVYEMHGALPPALRNDMLHIALARVAEVDVVVSWNFKHIGRLDKIRMFNAVNVELGYKLLQIYSPREVTLHGRDRDQDS